MTQDIFQILVGGPWGILYIPKARTKGEKPPRAHKPRTPGEMQQEADQ
jgi:hypothetical protein